MAYPQDGNYGESGDAPKDEIADLRKELADAIESRDDCAHRIQYEANPRIEHLQAMNKEIEGMLRLVTPDLREAYSDHPNTCSCRRCYRREKLEQFIAGRW